MSPPTDPQDRTIEAFVTAWKKQDLAGIFSLWSDDFKQGILPTTLGIPEKPRADAEYVFTKLTGVLSDWKVGDEKAAPCHYGTYERSSDFGAVGDS